MTCFPSVVRLNSKAEDVLEITVICKFMEFEVQVPNSFRDLDAV